MRMNVDCEAVITQVPTCNFGRMLPVSLWIANALCRHFFIDPVTGLKELSIILGLEGRVCTDSTLG